MAQVAERADGEVVEFDEICCIAPAFRSFAVIMKSGDTHDKYAAHLVFARPGDDVGIAAYSLNIVMILMGMADRDDGGGRAGSFNPISGL
jgi:hypothetical protein